MTDVRPLWRMFTGYDGKSSYPTWSGKSKDTSYPTWSGIQIKGKHKKCKIFQKSFALLFFVSIFAVPNEGDQIIGVWRSWLAHLVWDQRVLCSSHSTPTKEQLIFNCSFFCLTLPDFDILTSPIHKNRLFMDKRVNLRHVVKVKIVKWYRRRA